MTTLLQLGVYKSRNQTYIFPIYQIRSHLSVKITENTEFLAAEGNELKTLEVLSWKVPD